MREGGSELAGMGKLDGFFPVGLSPLLPPSVCHATPAASDDAADGRTEGMTDAQEPRCKQAENDGNDRARERPSGEDGGSVG